MSKNQEENFIGTVPSDWKLIMTADEIKVVVRSLAQKISDDYRGKDLVLVAILAGAAYFMVDLSRRLTIPHSVHFIHASSYHDSQTQAEKVRIGADGLSPKKYKNKQVLLVDELYDNGKTMHAVRQTLLSEQSLGLSEDSVKSCVCFRKEKENPLFPPPDYTGISGLPDLWFVGYGLDDAGDKRGLMSLWAMPKVPGVPQTSSDRIFTDIGGTLLSTMRQSIIRFIDKTRCRHIQQQNQIQSRL
mmetsp:Transcript_547/g.752  ORF Transcript_547/g.752 Transcript_547/m.752 type:complete len:244 (+) Transcript_547:74-805(+)